MEDRVYSPNEMNNFLHYYNSGKFPNQRLGQAFCNHFNRTDPDLFYQEDRKLAEEYIWLFLVM